MPCGTSRPTTPPSAALLGAVAVVIGLLAWAAPAQAVPQGFSDRVVLSGLQQPTSLAFAPDGRVFVAEKSGLIKVFSSLGDSTPTRFADLRTKTYNNGDQGLLGIVLDPDFPDRPYVYVSYTLDAEIGDKPPKWGAVDGTLDPCPTPPGPIDDGCVASGRLSRLTASGNTMTSEKVLVSDWCQQYWGHSTDDVVFGSDGALYMSAGDGAAYNFADYGQRGDPLNPCGDPPAGVGGLLSPPTAEGGALRSQDYQTTGDPLGLDGTLIRVDPDTGRPVPDIAGTATPSAVNYSRVVAYGFRNPYRIAVRPGTDEIWVADVGWSRWDEINRIDTTAPPGNFGWPCMEGATLRPQSYESLGLDLCDALYADGGGVTPFFSYRHETEIVPGEDCDEENGSAITGITFYTANDDASAYPSGYGGSLFFTDYVRGCLWVMPVGDGGLPDPTEIRNFGRIAGAVDLEQGPDGAIYYPSIVDGEIHRISYAASTTDQPPKPTIAIPATDTSYTTGEQFSFSGSASDSEDGPIPGSALRWRLAYTDCGEQLCKELPLDVDPDGTGGAFTAPKRATAGDLQLVLTAIDSSGLTASAVRRITPRQVTLLLRSGQIGARVSIDGVKGRTPFKLPVLKGSAMIIATPRQQQLKGRRHRTVLVWKRWSDGGGRAHYLTANNRRTVVAHYKARKPGLDRAR